MSLQLITVEPLVNTWSSERGVAWTPEERTAVGQAIVDLSAVVTPRIVQDVALSDERTQEVFVSRALDRLEAALGQLAAPMRAELGIDEPVLRPGTAVPALGLRSATHDELEALPAVGDGLAVKIARYLAAHPEVKDMAGLDPIPGVGAATVAALRGHAYLDRPRQQLVSPTRWAFARSPSVTTFLDLLEATDLVFVYGDQSNVPRRLADGGGSCASRFAATIRDLTARARLRASAVDGVLASDADRRLRRHAKRAALLAATSEASGGVLINDAYVDDVAKVIENAATSLDLMVFLGTASPGTPEHPGPLRLVAAMEAAAARGVKVRIVLDQDDGGEPYKSFWINRPLVERFKANGVDVRFDEKDVLLHSKVLVADGSVVVVGSHNWTATANNDTHEVSLLLRGATLAGSFAQRFEALWASLDPA